MKLDTILIKAQANKYTFTPKKVREWIEAECRGKVLNLFAGKTKLKVDEVRVDTDPTFRPQYNMDAYMFINHARAFGMKFDTVILDPPFGVRKAKEKYEGRYTSKLKQIKDDLNEIIRDNGRVITCGYQTISMGKYRGFKPIKLAIVSHGGDINDTLITVEERIQKKLEAWCER